MRAPRTIKPAATRAAARPRCVPPATPLHASCSEAAAALRGLVERATVAQLAALAAKVGARMEAAGPKALDIALLHHVYTLRDIRDCRGLCSYLAEKHAARPATAKATLERLAAVLQEILDAKGTL
jgi:hypothetical protein